MVAEIGESSNLEALSSNFNMREAEMAKYEVSQNIEKYLNLKVAVRGRKMRGRTESTTVVALNSIFNTWEAAMA